MKFLSEIPKLAEVRQSFHFYICLHKAYITLWLGQKIAMLVHTANKIVNFQRYKYPRTDYIRFCHYYLKQKPLEVLIIPFQPDPYQI